MKLYKHTFNKIFDFIMPLQRAGVTEKEFIKAVKIAYKVVRKIDKSFPKKKSN